MTKKIVGTEWHVFVPNANDPNSVLCAGILGDGRGRMCLMPMDGSRHLPDNAPLGFEQEARKMAEMLAFKDEVPRAGSYVEAPEPVKVYLGEDGRVTTKHSASCHGAIGELLCSPEEHVRPLSLEEAKSMTPQERFAHSIALDAERAAGRKLVASPEDNRVQIVVTFLNGTTMYFPVRNAGWRVSEDRHIVLKGKDGKVILKRIPLDNVAYYTVEEL